MKLISALLLSAMLGVSASAADRTTQSGGPGARDLSALGDWTGQIRSCPQVGHPSVDELRRVPSVVRMRVTEFPGGLLSFEFLEDVPHLLGVHGFTASLDDASEFSTAVPLVLTVDGRLQEDAQMRFRGGLKRSKQKERLRFTAEYFFRISPGTTPMLHCLTFDLVRESSRGDREENRQSDRDPDRRIEDLDVEAETAVDLIMENLRAERFPCARAFEAAERLSVRSCGALHQSLHADETHALRVVDGVLAARSPAGAENPTWVRDGAIYRRSHSVGEVELTIELNAPTHEIRIRYPLKLASCPELEAVPPVGELEGAIPPSLIPESHVAPRYAGRARSQNKTGAVAVGALVRKDGSVGAVCVLRADPAGVGFEEAALEAVRQWRYTPALVDGEPVDVVIAVFVDFSLR